MIIKLKEAEYDVLAPLIETETDLDIIDQAFKTIPWKGKRKARTTFFWIGLKNIYK